MSHKMRIFSQVEIEERTVLFRINARVSILGGTFKRRGRLFEVIRYSNNIGGWKISICQLKSVP